MSVMFSIQARRRLRGKPADRGQVLVIFALLLIVLLGATALAFDYGSWLKVRRDYQNAADAATLAGAAHLSRPLSSTKHVDARQAAWDSLNSQLSLSVNSATLAASAGASTNGGVGVSAAGYRIWVASPASDAGTKYPGIYGSTTGTVFVWIEADNPSFFAGIFGIGHKTIPAWATAGTFPNRFAVITLRKNGQQPPPAPADININGGTKLVVHNGDVGGNWGMSINGTATDTHMKFVSSTSDTYGPYLVENVSGMTGGNGWTASQVINAAGNPVPVQFIQEVPDPMYPAPCLTYGVGGSTCLEDRTATFTSDHKATTSRVGDTCPISGDVDRLPPGRYEDISIPNGKCVLLDPTFGGVAGKQNGVYYVTGTLDMNNSGLLIGNGVTLVFDHGANLSMNAGASISLNASTTACGGLDCKFGAWTSGGNYSWTPGPSPTYAAPANPFERGMAAYVCRSAASCGTGGSAATTTNILVMNSGSGIDYRGLIYAPFDNVKLAGQPTHKDIGQIVSWTLFLTGSSQIDQYYDGPDSATATLIEPRTNQTTYP